MPATGTRAKALRLVGNPRGHGHGPLLRIMVWRLPALVCRAGNQRYRHREWVTASRVHGLRYTVTGTADWHNTEGGLRCAIPPYAG